MQRLTNDCADLGEHDGPILIFGGPNSNLEAIRAMRAEARRLGAAPAATICTGDIVAYGADPAATLAEIRDWDIATVMGNVEESLAAGAGDCACGYTPGSACDRLAARWFAFADERIGADERKFMAALPRAIRFAMGGRRITAVHGAPSRINRYVFASTPETEKLGELALSGGDGIVGGHCGIPFIDLPGGRLWCNAGAIGLPANDGTPRAWFLLLTAGRGGVTIDLRPLDYDFRRAAQKMRAAGLPPDYARALETGRWPPSDVLPPAEAMRAGVPLEPTCRFWRHPATRRSKASRAEQRLGLDS